MRNLNSLVDKEFDCVPTAEKLFQKSIFQTQVLKSQILDEVGPDFEFLADTGPYRTQVLIMIQDHIHVSEQILPTQNSTFQPQYQPSHNSLVYGEGTKTKSGTLYHGLHR